MKKSIGFIGGGRITRIFLEGWRKDKQSLDNITVSDANGDLLGKLESEYHEIKTSAGDNSRAAGAQIVFVALHPPVIREALESVKSFFSKETVLVSLAPKVSIQALSGLTGLSKIVRMIPNAPSIVGEGYNPVAFSPGFPKTEAKEFLKIMKPLGDFPEVEEGKLEAYAIITAMGPTYLWFQLSELNELAISFGLSEKEAAKALSKMTKGALKTLFDSDLQPGEVADLVPVKPIGEAEPDIRNMYRSKLTALYGKLKG